METYQARVSNELSCEPQERFLEVVVGFSRDIVVLEVLLAVESDSLGLHFPLFDVDLVTAEDDRYIFTNTDEIT